MTGWIEVHDYRLSLLITDLMYSKPSPELKDDLNRLVAALKELDYPAVELVDIISIKIMLEYILKSSELIVQYGDFIRDSIYLISDILGDGLYIKLEPRIIFLEDYFYRNICIDRLHFENILLDEIKQLI